jgi:homoserine kinase
MFHARAEAFAPATVANLGVGFDILGMAVEGAGDTIIAVPADGTGAKILSIEGDGGNLSHDADKNVATIAANALLNALNRKDGIGFHLKKGLPLASGMGSSAASSVAGALAVNALLGYPFKKEELLPFTLEGEASVSGYHADNVAPCLLGGITLNNGTAIEDIRRLPAPANLHLALVTPDVAVPTSEARAVLPKDVSLKTMVKQTGAVAELMDALYRGDIRGMAKAMEADAVVEPARAHLMPYLQEIRFAAKRAGALGLVISGAGPTLCAICDDAKVAERVASDMQAVYTSAGLASIIRACGVMTEGATVKAE